MLLAHNIELNEVNDIELATFLVDMQKRRKKSKKDILPPQPDQRKKNATVPDAVINALT